MTKRTADQIAQAERLYNSTPNGVIVDADTILFDLLEKANHEFSGIALDVFGIWKESSDKSSVEQMFFEFTDVEFADYLERVIAETTRS